MRRSGAAVAAVVVATVMVTALAACTARSAPPPLPPPPAASTTDAPVSEPTELVVAVDAIGAGFNPHVLAHVSPVTTALARLVLPSVFRVDEGGTPRLDRAVATSARVVSAEPFTVSYELSLDALWSSGPPIAAEDFVYLWERMRDEPGVTDAAGYREITEIRSRAGGKAVDVVFDEPYPAWRRLFSGLLPAHVLKDAPGSWISALTDGLPASGGPFRIASVDRARGEVVLARNDRYWATPAVLDQLVLRRLDGPALAAGLAVGDVDVALPTVDPDVRQTLRGLGSTVRVQPAPQPWVTQLGLRADSGPLADPRVRRAVGAIVDREAVRAAVAPEALPADAFGLAPSEPGYSSTAPGGAPARPDPAAAQALLTEAGWTRSSAGGWRVDGAAVQLVVGAAAERPDDVAVAEVVAAQLAAAGIGATVVAPPGADLFGLPTVAPVQVSRTPTPSETPAPGGTSAPGGAPGPGGTPLISAPDRPGTALGGEVQVDVLVGPRTVGGDPGTGLASNYGCAVASAAGPPSPTAPPGFCFPALDLLLDPLLEAPTAGSSATVERVLWAQLPVLPLFQPVTLVVSTPATDTATDIAPGPLVDGPAAGAENWSEPVR